MSNYSDFFGVGSSGGGGGGAPINSYTPFLVSSTGNPTGYDSTTGLYTHPDGTFWLRTGNTLTGVTATYPDATQVAAEVPLSSYVSTGGASAGSGASSDSTFFQSFSGGTYWQKVANANTNNFVEYTFGTNVATGNTIAQGGTITANGRVVGVDDGSHIYLVHQLQTTVYQFNRTGGFGYTGVNFNLTNGTNGKVQGMGAYQNVLYVAGVGKTTIDRYQLPGGAFLNAVPSSTIPNQEEIFTMNGETGYGYLSTGLSSTQQLNPVTLTVVSTLASGTLRQNLYDPATLTLYLGRGPRQNPISIGDGTASTDASTSRPMFIRLK